VVQAVARDPHVVEWASDLVAGADRRAHLAHDRLGEFTDAPLIVVAE
jgi:hypothetical protein